MIILLIRIFLIFFLFFIAILVALFVVFEGYMVLTPSLKGAPFLPSSRKKIKTMIALADLKADDIAVDLGSGNGVLIAAAAACGARAIGVEVNPFLVYYSRWRIKKQNFGDRARIVKEDLRTYPLGHATIIFFYLMPDIVDFLRVRFEKELKSGTRIISNTFPIPGWTPERVENKIYVYVKK